MLKKRLTLRDIAKKANVSLTSASMYLNGKARANHISEKTCARIEEVIRRENYQPNVHARAMAMTRTILVWCVMRDSLESSFWADILAGIDEILAPENMHLLLTVSSGGLEAEIQAFEFLRAKGVDSYIWIPTVKRDGSNNYERIREFSAERPVITLTSLVDGLHGVAVDDEIGGRLAAHLFFENGHRCMATLGGSRIYRRCEYFAEEARKCGATVTSFKHIEDMADSIRNFTAVFCFADMKALELYKFCAGRGIRIPQDISVIGYDNLLFTDLMLPSLTTIHQPKRDLGRETGKLVLQALADKKLPPRQIKLPPELILRASTAKYQK